MSIKDNNLEKTSNDIVRSQLSSAYEEGIPTTGDRPDDTRPLEDVITIKSNPITDTFDDYDPSPKINERRNQKIATFQIEKSEIPAIKEMLDARYLEDAIDRAVVQELLKKVYTTNPEDTPRDLQSKFDSIRESTKKVISDTIDIKKKALAYAYSLYGIQIGLAKGEVLARAEDFIKGNLSSGNMGNMEESMIDKYDRHEWRKVSLITGNDSLPVGFSPTNLINQPNQSFVDLNSILAPNVPPDRGGDQSSPGLLQKLSYLMFEDTSFGVSLSNMTLTAILAQFMRETEYAFDHAVPYHFLLNDRSVAAQPILSEGITSKLVPYPSSFPTLSDLFLMGYSNKTKTGSRQAVLLSGPITDLGLERGVSPQDSVHPLKSLPSISIFYGDLEKRLVYLSTIIEREMALSAGIGRLLDEDEETLKTITNNTAVSLLSDKPLNRIYNSPPSQNILGTLSRPNMTANNMAGLNSKYGVNSLEYKIGDQSYLPYEIFDDKHPKKDALVGANKKTYKDLVIDPIKEAPLAKKALDALNVRRTEVFGDQKDRIDNLRKFVGYSSRAGVHSNNLLLGLSSLSDDSLEEGSSLSRAVLNKVYDSVASMIIEASVLSDPEKENSTINYQNYCDLFALTQFLKPEGQIGSSAKRTKKNYIQRLCEYDLSRRVKILDEGQTLDVKAPTAALDYSQDFKDGFLEKYKNKIINTGGFEDLFSIERNIFKILSTSSTSGWKYGGQNSTYSEGQEVHQFIHDIAISLGRNTLQPGSGLTADDLADSLDFSKRGHSLSISGYDVIRYVFGPNNVVQNQGEGQRSLSDTVLMICDSIENETLKKTGSPLIGFATQNGVTFGNGMDRAQLVVYVLEMISIVANDLVQSYFIHSVLSSQQTWSSLDSTQSNKFTARNHNGNTSVGKHCIALWPKKSNFSIIKNKNQGTTQIYSLKSGKLFDGGMTFTSFGNFVREVTKITRDTMSNPNPYFLSSVKSAGEERCASFENTFWKIQDITTGEDCCLGEVTTARKLLSMYQKTAEFAGYPAYAFSGASQIFKYVNEREANTDIADTITNQILELNSSILNTGVSTESVKRLLNNLSFTAAESIDDFISDIHEATAGEIDGIPHPGYTRNESSYYLKKAAKMALDKIESEALTQSEVTAEGKNFINFFFLGLSSALSREKAINAINENGLISTKNNSLFHRLHMTFSKSSEMNEELQFEQNESVLKPIRISLVHTVSYLRIINATAGDEFKSPATTFDDLVDKCIFKISKEGSGNPLDQKTSQMRGEDIIIKASTSLSTINPDEMREMLSNVVLSKLITYIFETVSRVPVDSKFLSNTKNQTISRSTLKAFLDILRPEFFLEQTYSFFPKDVDEVIDLMFEKDLKYLETGGSISDPIKLRVDLKDAFKPKLKRDGLNVYFDPPPVSERLFGVIQAILKSTWLMTNAEGESCVDESVLRNRVVGDVIAISSGKISNKTSFDVVSDNDTDDLQEDSIRIDNYRMLISQKLDGSI